MATAARRSGHIISLADSSTGCQRLLIHTEAPQVTAVISGDELPVVREVRAGKAVWVLDPYARLPRLRDRVGGNRPVLK